MTASNAARHTLHRSGPRAGQGGFTLLEVLASMVIGGALLGALVPAIFEITRVTSLNTTSITAAVQVESAARWLAKDGQGAQNTNLVDGAPAVNTVTLSWTDYTSWGTSFANPGQFTTHSITYSLSGTNLRRSLDGNTRTVASDVTSILFSRSGRVMTIAVTAAPPGLLPFAHQRTYNVTLRSLAPADNGVGPLHYYP